MVYRLDVSRENNALRLHEELGPCLAGQLAASTRPALLFHVVLETWPSRQPIVYARGIRISDV